MRVYYRTNKLEKQCTDASQAQKTYGRDIAAKLQMRIDQITAAESIEELVQCRIGDCHPLTGDRKGQFAMSLAQPHRLIIISSTDDLSATEVISIEDYH